MKETDTKTPKFVPKLFNTDMVGAIQKGTKNQTRRTKGLKKVNDDPDLWGGVGWSPDRVHLISKKGDFVETFPEALPRDIFWVRETWQITHFLHPSDENYGYIHKASENGREWERTEDWKWKPSIFMPKEACRIFLEVVNVRLERLQYISEKDALAEGINLGDGLEQFHNYGPGYKYLNSAVESFFSLWQSINGKQSLDLNPWVFVYDFKIVPRPKNFIKS